MSCAISGGKVSLDMCLCTKTTKATTLSVGTTGAWLGWFRWHVAFTTSAHVPKCRNARPLVWTEKIGRRGNIIGGTPEKWTKRPTTDPLGRHPSVCGLWVWQQL